MKIQNLNIGFQLRTGFDIIFYLIVSTAKKYAELFGGNFLVRCFVGYKTN